MLSPFPRMFLSLVCFYTSWNVTFSKVSSVRRAGGGSGGAGRAERGLAAAPAFLAP